MSTPSNKRLFKNLSKL